MAGLDLLFANFNNPANIVICTMGDSTTKGTISVTNGGWPEQLRLLAESRWGRGGDGIHTLDRNWVLTTSPRHQ